MLIINIAALAIIALLPGVIAHRRGRSFWTWWVFGLLLWPLALILALLLPRSQCPHCRRHVHPAATVCAHCGRDQPTPITTS